MSATWRILLALVLGIAAGAVHPAGPLADQLSAIAGPRHGGDQLSGGELRRSEIEPAITNFFGRSGGLLLSGGYGSEAPLALFLDHAVDAVGAARPDLTVIGHLVLSYPHKDHLKLMPDVFAAFAIRNVLDSRAVNRTVGYCRFLKAVAAEPGSAYQDAIASTASACARSSSPTTAALTPSA